MKEQKIEKIKQKIIDKYNVELLAKHVERLEKAIKLIRKQIDSGYTDTRKLNTIDLIVQNAEKFI